MGKFYNECFSIVEKADANSIYKDVLDSINIHCEFLDSIPKDNIYDVANKLLGVLFDYMKSKQGYEIGKYFIERDDDTKRDAGEVVKGDIKIIVAFKKLVGAKGNSEILKELLPYIEKLEVDLKKKEFNYFNYHSYYKRKNNKKNIELYLHEVIKKYSLHPSHNMAQFIASL